MRLIDADALKELIVDKIDERFRWDYKLTVCEFKTIIGDIIDNAPAVIKCGLSSEGLPLMDLRPRPQGEWKVFYTRKKKKVFKCDKCMAVSIQGQTNFCPNCGAKMKGGAEND